MFGWDTYKLDIMPPPEPDYDLKDVISKIPPSGVVNPLDDRRGWEGLVVRTFQGIMDRVENSDPEDGMDPFENEVQVSWPDGTVANINFDEIDLVDRTFLVGDIVERRSANRECRRTKGLVISIEQILDVEVIGDGCPSIVLSNVLLHPVAFTPLSSKPRPLIPLHSFEEGSVVVGPGWWLGVVESCRVDHVVALDGGAEFLIRNTQDQKDIRASAKCIRSDANTLYPSMRVKFGGEWITRFRETTQRLSNGCFRLEHLRTRHFSAGTVVGFNIRHVKISWVACGSSSHRTIPSTKQNAEDLLALDHGTGVSFHLGEPVFINQRLIPSGRKHYDWKCNLPPPFGSGEPLDATPSTSPAETCTTTPDESSPHDPEAESFTLGRVKRVRTTVTVVWDDASVTREVGRNLRPGSRTDNGQILFPNKFVRYRGTGFSSQSAQQRPRPKVKCWWSTRQMATCRITRSSCEVPPHLAQATHLFRGDAERNAVVLNAASLSSIAAEAVAPPSPSLESEEPVAENTPTGFKKDVGIIVRKEGRNCVVAWLKGDPLELFEEIRRRRRLLLRGEEDAFSRFIAPQSSSECCKRHRTESEEETSSSESSPRWPPPHDIRHIEERSTQTPNVSSRHESILGDLFHGGREEPTHRRSADDQSSILRLYFSLEHALSSTDSEYSRFFDNLELVPNASLEYIAEWNLWPGDIACPRGVGINMDAFEQDLAPRAADGLTEADRKEMCTGFVEIVASCGGVVWVRTILGQIVPVAVNEIRPAITSESESDDESEEDDESSYDGDDEAGAEHRRASESTNASDDERESVWSGGTWDSAPFEDTRASRIRESFMTDLMQRPRAGGDARGNTEQRNDHTGANRLRWRPRSADFSAPRRRPPKNHRRRTSLPAATLTSRPTFCLH